MATPKKARVAGSRGLDQKIDLLLGRRLRGRRRLLGLTQGQLAEMVGVRFQQIQKYEAGANRISAARLWRLCQALEAPVSYFFDGLPTDGRIVPLDREDGAELLARPESMDLIRAFRQLDEHPRRQLLDLARSLKGDLDLA